MAIFNIKLGVFNVDFFKKSFIFIFYFFFNCLLNVIFSWFNDLKRDYWINDIETGQQNTESVNELSIANNFMLTH